MQISSNNSAPNFKAVLLSPNGYKALERWNKNTARNFVNIEEFQKQRINDKYIDAVISGIPDEYGHYSPIMYLKDKVTGETYRDMFKMLNAEGKRYFKVNTTHEGRFNIMSKNGDKLPDDVAELVISKDRARYFSFIDSENPEKFKNFATKTWIGGVCLSIIEAMELYYRQLFENNEDNSAAFKCKKDTYIDFILNLEKEYGKKQVHEIIPEIIKEENLLGKGKEKDVYEIDKMPGYVLCVMRNEYDPTKPITPFYQHFHGAVVHDSPILVNDSGMYIKKYTTGISHSLPDRIEKNHGVPLTYDDVNCFMSQLKNLSSFPTKSFVNFAKKLQSFNERRIRIDFNNPNNILIDSDLETINLIDLNSDDNKIPDGMIRPLNGLSDMESVLCDSMMYLKLYNIATDEDKTKMDEYAKTIIKKCGIASKVTNLGNFPQNTKIYFESIDKDLPVKSGKSRLQKFEDFRNHFKGTLSEEIASTQYKFYM